jgi:hypothetical protein
MRATRDATGKDADSFKLNVETIAAAFRYAQDSPKNSAEPSHYSLRVGLEN